MKHTIELLKCEAHQRIWCAATSVRLCDLRSRMHGQGEEGGVLGRDSGNGSEINGICMREWSDGMCDVVKVPPL